MDKVNINLLPTEVSKQQLEQSKFNRVQAISIGVILLIILAASLSVTMRIIQQQNLNKVKETAKGLEVKVTQYKDKEATLVILKNRIAAVTQLLTGPSKQTQMYNLITELIPAEVDISSINVDRSGTVIVAMTAPDSNLLELTLQGLTSEEAYQSITKIDVESLSGNRDGSYRINLKISPKS